MRVSLELLRLIVNVMTDCACFISTEFSLDYACLGCSKGV